MQLKRKLSGLVVLGVLVLFAELVLYDIIASQIGGNIDAMRKVVAILGTYFFICISEVFVRYWWN